MEFDNILNLWIIPFSVTMIFFLFYYCKTTIIKIAKKSRKKSDFLFLLDNFRINIDDWKKTILLPIISAILLNVIVMAVFMAKPVKYDIPFWFLASMPGFANPVSEEFLIRGFLLGLFVFGAWKFRFKDKNKYFLYFIGLIFLSYIFTISHINMTLYQYVIRFSNSILFSILYLINKRNLLPSIIAHAAGNWLFILGQGF
ncbi:MAG TPA: CPBP family intramembrane glutamic endopeptidase [archaeon]|nr:CPBP family intramembrane glutamic endopeptidase [archaeon]